MNAYLRAVSWYLLKRPVTPPWPAAAISVLSSSGLTPVYIARSLATHLAGSKYCTCESSRAVITNIAG